MQSSKKQLTSITALYCRLSRDDGTDKESNSIANQKKMLQSYARTHGLINTKVYADDGFPNDLSRPTYSADLREGVSVEYITCEAGEDILDDEPEADKKAE